VVVDVVLPAVLGLVLVREAGVKAWTDQYRNRRIRRSRNRRGGVF
jgi:hypothetical protein